MRAQVSASVAAVGEQSMQESLEELERRRQAALHAGSEAAVERQHSRGKMTARERIDYLLDAGSFQELDMLARSRAEAALREDKRSYTDGVVTGLRHHRREKGMPVLPGLHGQRGDAGRGVGRKDP